MLPDPLSDEALWQRAVAGDGGAFAQVYDRHVDTVFSYCLRQTVSAADAEDVTSVVFFEAWRKARSVTFVAGSVKPWLLAVAMNVARNQARSRHRYQRMLERLPAVAVTPDIADVAIRDVESEEFTARFVACMNTLPARERDVIALCDLAELSYDEAAAALGVPVGTVRSRLSRGRRRLRALLASAQSDERIATAVRARQNGDLP
jgi:RNA polymerase sigma-70 factor (ECF subfamily)